MSSSIATIELRVQSDKFESFVSRDECYQSGHFSFFLSVRLGSNIIIYRLIKFVVELKQFLLSVKPERWKEMRLNVGDKGNKRT